MPRSYTVKVHSEFRPEDVMFGEMRLGAFYAGSRYHLIFDNETTNASIGSNYFFLDFDPSLTAEDCSDLGYWGDEWETHIANAVRWYNEGS